MIHFQDMIARRFRSPLLGTALVLASLAVVAIPLHRLTAHHGGSAPVPPAAVTSTPPSSATIGAVLRIRTLDPIHDLEIRNSKDEVVFQTTSMEPGETEHDADILLENGNCELHLSARTGDKETAVFLTLLPDGREERTAYTIGSGQLDETLHFHWHEEHE